MDPYDALFYESLCLPETHPNRLAVLGRLMGLAAADPRTCRVLELGCATGGNLIPMAYRLPRARFLGVDLSGAQIAAGTRVIESLGLKNIDLRHADIRDLDEDAGEFDYIIAHGVYSWVPADVRRRLLWLARRLLAPNGVVYISFNTLPGWRMRGMLRDLLLDACREQSDPGLRLAAAQAALRRLEAALRGLPGLSAQYLRTEIDGLRDKPPSYLYFEYLAEHNEAFLFRDFAAAAESHGLRYLCDADLQTLFPASYGEAVETALADIEDGLDLEQWLDFTIGRNFRQSLLFRDDATADETISLDRFAGLSFSADLVPPDRLALGRAGRAAFMRPTGDAIEVSHPLTKAVTARLARRYPDALSLAELLPEAQRHVQEAGGGQFAGEIDSLLSELFGLFARGALGAHVHPRVTGRERPARPRATKLALAQVGQGRRQVASLDHGNLEVDASAARLIGLLDGTRSVEELVERMKESSMDEGIGPGRFARNGRHGHGETASQPFERVARNWIELFRRYGVLEE